jgi:nitric oxide reductase large subunit
VELSQILFITAYCIFMAGAAKSFRDNGSTISVWIMSGGVMLDFLMSMLPVLGVKALSSNLKGTNGVIIFALVLGFLVWLTYVAALIVRKRGNKPLFHVLIAVTEISWFIDFISFLYGMYKFPLH